VGVVANAVKEFLLESYEFLDRLDRDLVVLEKQPSKEMLGAIFRVIHTIKGNCGFLGFSKLGSVTHAGEGLLALMREGRVKANSQVTDTLLAMVDAARKLLADIESTGKEGSGDYTPIIEALNSLQQEGRNRDIQSASMPLGDILVAQGRIDRRDLDRALKQQANGDGRRIGEILMAQGSVTQTEIIDALQTQRELKSAVLENSVRIDLDLLDKLVNLVSELVLCRNQIMRFTAMSDDPAFSAAFQHLDLITGNLQDEVMKTRMQPIGELWNKFPRFVRDLAASCGKQIRLEIEGAETELDRTVIEAIRDPLTHIVRNAVDHGIEDPQARVAAGKPSEGRVIMHAYHEGGQVNIEISDDGAGIDREKVLTKVLQRGLLTREQAAGLGESDLINLIFLPGFSTVDQVTKLSGRGVGMEVVKTSIEKIGGTTEIHSRVGQGTILKIKIPLTLAIIPVLMVVTSGQRYAIPQANLLELVRLEGEHSEKQIELVHNAPVYRLRGRLLPLVFLNRELQLTESPKHEGGATVNIVVLQAGKRQFGLVVDSIHDSKEIVVKPLGKPLKNLKAFSGATILGDGNVALILDVNGLFHRLNVVHEVRDTVPLEKALQDQQAVEARERLLICHYGSHKENRVGVPLSAVARLEEFPHSAIEKSNGREVVQYRGEIMPLIRLSRALGNGGENPNEESIQVLVYKEHGQSVGIVVANIDEIVEQQFNVRPQEKGNGFMGSVVVQNRVTDILDVRAVIDSVEPSLLSKPVAA